MHNHPRVLRGHLDANPLSWSRVSGELLCQPLTLQLSRAEEEGGGPEQQHSASGVEVSQYVSRLVQGTRQDKIPGQGMSSDIDWDLLLLCPGLPLP